MRTSFSATGRLAAALVLGSAAAAAAATVPAPGYLYQRDVLDEPTEGCVAQAPGGVFVVVGPALAFPPDGGTRDVLFVSGTGVVRTVATGLNAVGDCAYDPASDLLYVTDSGAEFSGATSGDTVFAIPGHATDVPVAGLEVLPVGSIPFAFSIERFGPSSLLVSDAAGGGLGSVLEIDLSGPPPSLSTFASGFDYTGGVAAGGGRVFVAESVEPFFESAIQEYTPAGGFVATLSGPTYAHGSVDLAIGGDGDLLVTGLPTIASLDDDGGVTPLVSGLDGGTGFDAYGGGVSVNRFTGRIDFLASSFTGGADDRSVHHLVPVDRLVAGDGRARTDCALEFYGIELDPPAGRGGTRTASCRDGEPCDADGIVNGVCRFPLGLCLNVPDPRRPRCTPSRVTALELTKSVPHSTDVDALVAATLRALPTADAACVFGNGVHVPVRSRRHGRAKAGERRIELKATIGHRHPRTDNDGVTLVCEPAR